MKWINIISCILVVTICLGFVLNWGLVVDVALLLLILLWLIVKSKDWIDIFARILAFMFFIWICGAVIIHVQQQPRPSDTSSVYEFKNEQHIQKIASAIRLELSSHESLEVSYFRHGERESTHFLTVNIRGVQSVEGFLSRMNTDVSEANVTLGDNKNSYGFDLLNCYKINKFIVTDENGKKIDNILIFYSNGTEVHVDFLLWVEHGTPLPTELKEVADILNSYFPKHKWSWFAPHVFIPTVSLIAIIIFLIRRRR